MKYCPTCKRQYEVSQRFCPDDGRFLSLQDPYGFVGRVVADRYRIDALAAMGGFGAVYSAQHLGTDRHCAFKILQPNHAYVNSKIVEMFEREAKMASKFFHENIVLVFDAGRTSENVAYMVMEWLDGRTLEDELARQPQMELSRIADLLRQIAAALDVAHQASTIHRDLKPSNIMLALGSDGRDRLKVVDFGIGKVVTQEAGSTISVLVGTPDYASPEQFRPGAQIDRRTDIYSLGVILYRMITGELPFEPTTVSGQLHHERPTTPISIRARRPDVPEAIETLVMSMLAEDIAVRPSSAGNVAHMFDRAIQAPDDTDFEPEERSVASRPIDRSASREANVGHLTIYKYPIFGRAVLQRDFAIDMPEDARILCVQVQNGAPCIWAMVDPSLPMQPRHFVLVGTGQPLGGANSGGYVGSFQLEYGVYVFHLFEGRAS